VPIAILDSGVDGAHSDLASKLVAGYNFLTMNTDTADRSGHGTQVAGSAAAATNNNLGVASVAGNNPILPVVVMDSSNYATYSNIARGITYAADRGVRIINISITGPTSSSTLQSAVDYAWSKNAVVFAAAGNSGSTAPGYPAACAKVVAVGATDENDARAGWSNYGSWITVVAPGVNVLTTLAGGSYGGASGTSFASPIAAGVGALMLSVRPQLTAADLTSLLRSSTRDLGAPGVDSEFGGGRVDANRAVLAAQQAVLQTVAPPPTTIQPKPGKGNRK
jgi:subtilisin family serine protease